MVDIYYFDSQCFDILHPDLLTHVRLSIQWNSA